ncbi:uncharacterized protein MONOS_3025 [Monocercomonoides exilis]|uniref:uncharacterized protein n=1 Tax=Monocercomonoides exilis TaxID=2049356 RepID=UPI00355A4153|nr:hypothetical protein MONOS_3025 [Monocercomonoides exilis]|eukprot:MONOS_3025.1-p1 / transcript=MONOS_3025.1 / gene=MONOS_3025 / organism=Monocercomonoides_exilis_PA203 / gene_product=unspecified product / transcript_product=unspecified product / location=Mono_scaffold00067:48189-55475(+) / protein_length=2429 / sequence_SO=supercontig / SO=protein_coding / is_pseudo=false
MTLLFPSSESFFFSWNYFIYCCSSSTAGGQLAMFLLSNQEHRLSKNNESTFIKDKEIPCDESYPNSKFCFKSITFIQNGMGHKSGDFFLDISASNMRQSSKMSFVAQNKTIQSDLPLLFSFCIFHHQLLKTSEIPSVNADTESPASLIVTPSNLVIQDPSVSLTFSPFDKYSFSTSVSNRVFHSVLGSQDSWLPYHEWSVLINKNGGKDSETCGLGFDIPCASIKAAVEMTKRSKGIKWKIIITNTSYEPSCQSAYEQGTIVIDDGMSVSITGQSADGKEEEQAIIVPIIPLNYESASTFATRSSLFADIFEGDSRKIWMEISASSCEIEELHFQDVIESPFSGVDISFVMFSVKLSTLKMTKVSFSSKSSSELFSVSTVFKDFASKVPQCPLIYCASSIFLVTKCSFDRLYSNGGTLFLIENNASLGFEDPSISSALSETWKLSGIEAVHLPEYFPNNSNLPVSFFVNTTFTNISSKSSTTYFPSVIFSVSVPLCLHNCSFNRCTSSGSFRGGAIFVAFDEKANLILSNNKEHDQLADDFNLDHWNEEKQNHQTMLELNFNNVSFINCEAAHCPMQKEASSVTLSNGVPNQSAQKSRGGAMYLYRGNMQEQGIPFLSIYQSDFDKVSSSFKTTRFATKISSNFDNSAGSSLSLIPFQINCCSFLNNYASIANNIFFCLPHLSSIDFTSSLSPPLFQNMWDDTNSLFGCELDSANNKGRYRDIDLCQNFFYSSLRVHVSSDALLNFDDQPISTNLNRISSQHRSFDWFLCGSSEQPCQTLTEAVKHLQNGEDRAISIDFNYASTILTEINDNFVFGGISDLYERWVFDAHKWKKLKSGEEAPHALKTKQSKPNDIFSKFSTKDHSLIQNNDLNDHGVIVIEDSCVVSSALIMSDCDIGCEEQSNKAYGRSRHNSKTPCRLVFIENRASINQNAIPSDYSQSDHLNENNGNSVSYSNPSFFFFNNKRLYITHLTIQFFMNISASTKPPVNNELDSFSRDDRTATLLLNDSEEKYSPSDISALIVSTKGLVWIQKCILDQSNSYYSQDNNYNHNHISPYCVMEFPSLVLLLSGSLHVDDLQVTSSVTSSSLFIISSRSDQVFVHDMILNNLTLYDGSVITITDEDSADAKNVITTQRLHHLKVEVRRCDCSGLISASGSTSENHAQPSFFCMAFDNYEENDLSERTDNLLIFNVIEALITDCSFKNCSSCSQKGGTIYANLSKANSLHLTKCDFINSSVTPFEKESQITGRGSCLYLERISDLSDFFIGKITLRQSESSGGAVTSQNAFFFECDSLKKTIKPYQFRFDRRPKFSGFQPHSMTGAEINHKINASVDDDTINSNDENKNILLLDNCLAAKQFDVVFAGGLLAKYQQKATIDNAFILHHQNEDDCGETPSHPCSSLNSAVEHLSFHTNSSIVIIGSLLISEEVDLSMAAITSLRMYNKQENERKVLNHNFEGNDKNVAPSPINISVRTASSNNSTYSFENIATLILSNNATINKQRGLLENHADLFLRDLMIVTTYDLNIAFTSIIVSRNGLLSISEIVFDGRVTYPDSALSDNPSAKSNEKRKHASSEVVKHIPSISCSLLCIESGQLALQRVLVCFMHFLSSPFEIVAFADVALSELTVYDTLCKDCPIIRIISQEDFLDEESVFENNLTHPNEIDEDNCKKRFQALFISADSPPSFHLADSVFSNITRNDIGCSVLEAVPSDYVQEKETSIYTDNTTNDNLFIENDNSFTLTNVMLHHTKVQSFTILPIVLFNTKFMINSCFDEQGAAIAIHNTTCLGYSCSFIGTVLSEGNRTNKKRIRKAVSSQQSFRNASILIEQSDVHIDEMRNQNNTNDDDSPRSESPQDNSMCSWQSSMLHFSKCSSSFTNCSFSYASSGALSVISSSVVSIADSRFFKNDPSIEKYPSMRRNIFCSDKSSVFIIDKSNGDETFDDCYSMNNFNSAINLSEEETDDRLPSLTHFVGKGSADTVPPTYKSVQALWILAENGCSVEGVRNDQHKSLLFVPSILSSILGIPKEGTVCSIRIHGANLYPCGIWFEVVDASSNLRSIGEWNFTNYVNESYAIGHIPLDFISPLFKNDKHQKTFSASRLSNLKETIHTHALKDKNAQNTSKLLSNSPSPSNENSQNSTSIPSFSASSSSTKPLVFIKLHCFPPSTSTPFCTPLAPLTIEGDIRESSTTQSYFIPVFISIACFLVLVVIVVRCVRWQLGVRRAKKRALRRKKREQRQREEEREQERLNLEWFNERERERLLKAIVSNYNGERREGPRDEFSAHSLNANPDADSENNTEGRNRQGINRNQSFISRIVSFFHLDEDVLNEDSTSESSNEDSESSPSDNYSVLSNASSSSSSSGLSSSSSSSLGILPTTPSSSSKKKHHSSYHHRKRKDILQYQPIDGAVLPSVNESNIPDAPFPSPSPVGFEK